jgi:hypothetical protein
LDLSAGSTHDQLDGPLRDSVVVVGPGASVSNLLLSLRKVLGKGGGHEGRSVVGLVGVGDDTVVSAELFELLLCLDRLGGGDGGLHLDMDEAARLVNEDSAAGVLFPLGLLATRVQKAASGGADEVIDRDALSGMEVVAP